MVSILFAEDDPVQQRMLQTLLSKKYAHEVKVADHGRHAVEILKSSALDAFQVVLLDVSMPIMDGFETNIYANIARTFRLLC